MSGFAAKDVLSWTSGAARGTLPVSFPGLSTDTRSIRPGNLFVALRGERFDGHAFLGQAAAAGSAAAVVAAAPAGSPLPLITVEDTLVALGAIGRGHRLAWASGATGGPVVGITGSVGKTSTKEILAAALSPLGPVLKTEGNLNNEVGVPLTLLRLTPEHRAAAVEMGMNHLGEIARLAAIARPGVGVVLNVRGVHLEHLKTIENVAKAKGELFLGLPADGVAVANADDPLVMEQARLSGRRIVTFGQTGDVRFLSARARGLAGIELECAFGGRTWKAQLSLLGVHNGLNACAALAAAMAAGVPFEAAVAALPNARTGPHRLEVIELDQGVTIVDDCYNASPSSMEAALATLRSGAEGRRLGAILGDMLELGPKELDLHRQIGRACGGLGWLLCFGARSVAIAEGARAAGVGEVGLAQDLDGGMEFVREHLQRGDAVLLKASRGMKLERFAVALGAPERGGH